MLQNAFAGRTAQPTQKDLATTLGESYGLWQRLVADLKHDLKIDAEQWHTSSVKLGWSLRL